MKTFGQQRWIRFLVTFLLSALGASAGEVRDKINDLPPEVRAFAAAKEKQARELARNLDVKVSSDLWTFFDLARNGKPAEALTLYEKLRKRAGQYEGSKSDPGITNPVWQTALEVVLAVEAFGLGEPKYAFSFGRDIIDSIPRGAIYFGGTDPGRGLPTALCTSHERGDPFFTITQNAFADGNYLSYLREMYGHRLQMLSNEDSQKAFTDYMSDAQERMKKGRLKPGEDVKVVDNRVQVSGQVAVMAINALLAKRIFETNPDREFYVEESFPLDWMYPHLSPHGLIMKIHREPLKAISAEAIDKDRDDWNKQQRLLIGAWLRPETSVKELCDFATKVYWRKDLAGFTGDPKFVGDDRATKMYSKLRSSIAGLYAWRIDNASGEEERQRAKKEAEFAFKQAYAFCPISPEALYRFVNLLLRDGRINEARMLAVTTMKLDPENKQLDRLIAELDRMKKQQQPR
jgi:hypothetical protein